MTEKTPITVDEVRDAQDQTIIFQSSIIFLAQKKIQLSKFRQRWLYVGRIIVN